MDEFLTSAGSPRDFDGGVFVLLRLAPVDYHRFHAPMDSTLLSLFRVEGGLQSVNADAMRSRNYGLYNQRTVMLFNSTLVGPYAYVAIGALCVGSVTVEPPSNSGSAAGAGAGDSNPVGQTYAKGDKLGYFEFGGSTVALVFRPGTVRIDDHLTFASLSAVETKLNVKSRIGVAINPAANVNPGLLPT